MCRMNGLYSQDEQKKNVEFFAEGTVKQEIINVCFIGSEGAGKKTLTETLKRGWLKRIFKNENQADDATCENKHTIDINVIPADIPKVGNALLWCFASQKLFHKIHGLFFSASTSMFILLVSLVRGDNRRLICYEELQQELQYWLSFLRFSLDADFLPTVLIVASHRDYIYYRDG